MSTRQTLVATALAVALLCLPAVWNGSPILFDDVGGYLERWPTGSLGLGRSAVYGLLLWVTRAEAFVPVVLLQALVTTFVIDCAIKVFVRNAPLWLLPTIVAAVCATSGAAFFVSKLMPDAWAAPAVLGVYLLGWHFDGSDEHCRRLAGQLPLIAFRPRVRAAVAQPGTSGACKRVCLQTMPPRFPIVMSP